MLTRAETSWCDYIKAHRPPTLGDLGDATSRRPALDPTPDMRAPVLGRRNAEDAFGLTATSELLARLGNSGATDGSDDGLCG